MGHALLVFVFVVVFDWIAFMTAIRLLQFLANVQLPPGGSMAWKVALVALAAGVVSGATGMAFGPVVGLVVGIVVFWAITLRIYSVGAAPLLVVVVCAKVVGYGLLTAMMGWLYPGAAAVS